MYPEIVFKENSFEIEKIQKNVKKNNKVGAFFSGGIDAFATLFAHINEKPILITVWGADIQINDCKGWENTKNNIKSTAEMFSLEYQFIKSNFKEMFNVKELNKLISKCPDKWWHGFQHGIGLIGLSSPLAYQLGLSKIYIASSFTEKDAVTCASHPTIDNFVKFCNTQIVHDQYEYNRQEKIEHIVKYTNEVNKFPYIHVCWEHTGGENCCICEKCCRTIIGIYAANGNAKQYGFEKCDTKKIRNRMYYFNNIDGILVPIWTDIKEYFIKNKENNLYKRDIEWLEKLNPNNNRTVLKKFVEVVTKLLKKLNINKILFIRDIVYDYLELKYKKV